MTLCPMHRRRPRALALGVAAVVLGALAWHAQEVGAQGPASAAAVTLRTPVPARPSAQTKTEEGPRWQKLKPAQRDALKPLQQEWPQLDATSKLKWMQLADRLGKTSRSTNGPASRVGWPIGPS